MKNLTLPIGIFILVLIAGAILVILPGKSEAPTNTPAPGESAGIPDLITAESPRVGAAVSSPVTIAGEARGTWYFEATFPLEIRDASGNLIAQHYAEAQGEWMTEDFVPFSSTLSFPEQPSGSQGTIILRYSNASGDPERDQSVEIPVVF